MENTGKIILSLFVGAAIGAVAGILLAPDEGEMTRENLKNKIVDLKNQLLDLIEKGEDLASDKVKEIRTKIAKLENDLKAAIVQ